MTTLLRSLATLLATMSMAATATALAEDDDHTWNSGLRALYFDDRPIASAEGVISLDTPSRAEDPAVVPIAIRAAFPQTDRRYIQRITILIDNNPTPLVGRFELSPRSGRADLAMRVRVNAYSPLRAIAETNDGALYMTRRFVKASGGCSAPIGTDLEAAMSRLGRIKLDARPGDSGEPVQVQLRISHPNVTGLQMNQLTRLYAPAHYVKTVQVSYLGETLLSAETDISISENPSFRFGFVPQGPGKLEAVVIDSEGGRFTGELHYPEQS